MSSAFILRSDGHSELNHEPFPLCLKLENNGTVDHIRINLYPKLHFFGLKRLSVVICIYIYIYIH